MEEGPLDIDDLVAYLLRHLAAAPLRVAAEVCRRWRHAAAAVAARRNPAARRLSQHARLTGWELPHELAYYTQSPALLLWGCERFAALAPLRCLAAADPAAGGAPAWVPEARDLPIRRWAAWILHRSPRSLDAACAAAGDLSATFAQYQREQRSRAGTYTPAYHEYARLRQAVGSGPSTPRLARAVRAPRAAFAATTEGGGRAHRRCGMAETCRFVYPSGHACDSRRAPALGQRGWAAAGFCSLHARLLEEDGCLCMKAVGTRAGLVVRPGYETCGYCEARAAAAAAQAAAAACAAVARTATATNVASLLGGSGDDGSGGDGGDDGGGGDSGGDSASTDGTD